MATARMDFDNAYDHSGDRDLFKSLEPLLCQTLPQEPAEWTRLYGRATKSVTLSAIFVPFSKDILQVNKRRHLLKHPILHIFVTQCADIETYKSNICENIKRWLNILTQCSIADWVIILVETYDFRKHNKLLPRTTVLDKIKADFGAKHADRCLSVINPLKLDSGSSSSWRGLIVNLRLLILTAYDISIIKLEEFIRSQRECRNQPGWNFCSYFLMQEELAFVFEMLKIYEDALIQYDELDALFTQFIRNSSLTDTPEWLSCFQHEITKWSGLFLSDKVNENYRISIQEQHISLLEFRCYLFSRQAAMLVLSFKPWEIVQRTLPFIQNTLNELNILELPLPEGAISCWVFLCSLEVIQTCQKFNDTVHVDSCSRYTASLLELCTEKLYELGELCGLMPGYEPSSEQLHTIVGLLAGIGDAVCKPPNNNNYTTPIDKLKEALSSKDAFKRYYLELSEQAMVIYKHRGRVRSARLVGKKLADFYLRLGDVSKASGFLASALASYEEDNWMSLINETRLQLVNCYKKLGETEKFLRMCIPVASTEEIDSALRVSYFHEMMKIVQDYDSDWLVPYEDAFSISDVHINIQKIGLRVSVTLEIYNKLPLDILCSNIAISVSKSADINSDSNKPPSDENNSKYSSSFISHNMFFSSKVKNSDSAVLKLPIIRHLDYQEDKSLASAAVACRNMKNYLRRRDSQKSKKAILLNEVDTGKTLCSGSIILKSGKNNVTITSKNEDENGTYCLSQLKISVNGKLHFLSKSNYFSNVNYEINRISPEVVIVPQSSDTLLAGIENHLSLLIRLGTYALPENSVLKLRTSYGLTIEREKFIENQLQPEITIKLSNEEISDQKLSIQLRMHAEFTAQTENTPIDHKIWLTCPWSDTELCLTVPFYPPFVTTSKLHTSELRKFILITVCGSSNVPVELQQFDLSPLEENEFSLQSLNPSSSQPFIVAMGRKVKFMWQVVAQSNNNGDHCLSNEYNVLFSSDYLIRQQIGHHKCAFKVKNCSTLYTIESRIEPIRGTEFSRTNTTCHLILTITRISESDNAKCSLMYEIVTDQAMWAVCGTSTGVVILDDRTTDKCTIQLDVMPLVSGFLPLPSVKLSKYFLSDGKSSNKGSAPRRELFHSGQVYDVTKSIQVHVLPATTGSDL